MKNGNKGQRAKNKGQWTGIVIFMLIGAACGVLIMMYLDRTARSGKGFAESFLPFILLFVGMYAAMFIQIALHEAGHLIFGLLTGYRFCSFRIFGLMWVKTDGRVRFKRLNVAGTGGQCLMAPPDMKDGRMPVMLYNFGGAIVNLVAAALCAGLAFLCPVRSLCWTALMIHAVIALAFALMNGLPVKMGPVNNDGRNALELSRGGEATRAFRIQMDRMYVEMITRNRKEILEGMRSKDQLKIMKAMGKYPSVLRTEYAYALLSEKDPNKAGKILARFEKCAGSYPYPCEIEGERELIAIAGGMKP